MKLIDEKFYYSEADYWYGNVRKDGIVNKSNYFQDRLILMNSNKCSDFMERFKPTFYYSQVRYDFPDGGNPHGLVDISLILDVILHSDLSKNDKVWLEELLIYLETSFQCKLIQIIKGNIQFISVIAKSPPLDESDKPSIIIIIR